MFSFRCGRWGRFFLLAKRHVGGSSDTCATETALQSSVDEPYKVLGSEERVVLVDEALCCSARHLLYSFSTTLSEEALNCALACTFVPSTDQRFVSDALCSRSAQKIQRRDGVEDGVETACHQSRRKIRQLSTPLLVQVLIHLGDVQRSRAREGASSLVLERFPLRGFQSSVQRCLLHCLKRFSGQRSLTSLLGKLLRGNADRRAFSRFPRGELSAL